MTVRLFVRHAVADFEAWRKGYDANVDLRVRHGVKADGVHPSVDDPNDVTIFHDFETEEEARAMLGSPELKGGWPRHRTYRAVPVAGPARAHGGGQPFRHVDQ
jgi:hypothetical protein